jgi:hypothetical protein
MEIPPEKNQFRYRDVGRGAEYGVIGVNIKLHRAVKPR